MQYCSISYQQVSKLEEEKYNKYINDNNINVRNAQSEGSERKCLEGEEESLISLKVMKALLILYI